MFGIDDYPAFLGVSFALHAVPGQDVLFVLAQGLRGGRRPAAIGALGIGAGSLLFAIATALGVGLLVTAYPGALRAIRFAGGGYLAFLGTRSLVAAWRAYQSPMPFGLRASAEGAAFREGLITNVSNVKVLVFFWAFLPPFVDAQGVALGWGLLLLGLSFTLTGTLWNLGVAWLVGGIAETVRGSPRLPWITSISAGVIFLLLAVLALRP